MDLASIAKSFDPDADHKIKLGHDPILTSTPDMGDVVRLEYDEKKDRLFASVNATESLVEKNRKGEFRRVSMELNPADEGYAFGDLAFLGAHRPAIGGLTPVALAAGEDTSLFVCMADVADEEEDDGDSSIDFADFTADERKKLAEKGMAMPDGSYPIRNKEDLANAIQAIGRAKNPATVKAHIRKRARAMGMMDMLPEGWGKVAAAEGKESPDEGGLDTRRKVESDSDPDKTKEKTTMDDAAIATAKKLEEENKGLKASLAAMARDRAKAFLARDDAKKKLTLAELKSDGPLERVLTRLAEFDVEPSGPGKLQLAAADGKGTETDSTLFAALTTVLLGRPDKLTKEDTTERATDGLDDDTAAAKAKLTPVHAAMSPDPQGDVYALAAQQEIDDAKAKGETIDFAMAARRVYAKKGNRG